jgi:hypothetical protein
MLFGLQEARLELERLIAEGSHDMSLQQVCGAFPYTLDAFQQRSVESFLQGKFSHQFLPVWQPSLGHLQACSHPTLSVHLSLYSCGMMPESTL